MQSGFQFDWQAVFESLPYLLEGLFYTLVLSFGGIAIGSIIGIFFGLLSLGRTRLMRWPAVGYIEFFRGTPLLVQVLFIYYGLPQLIERPINAVVAGIAAIALNSGAYISEVVRGGVQSIARGQREAGVSLGLTHAQTFTYIIWPQALRRMIPSLGNQAIVSIKDTSIFSVIGIGEMVRHGQVYIASTFKAFEVYFMVAIVYLIITISLSTILRFFERRGFVGI